MTSQETPLVSLLIAMKNEGAFIADTLTAVFAQDYPAERMEVIVADGGSTDDSRQIVARLFAGRPNTLLVNNPGISASSGWNLGIERCRGDIIGIVSAHCKLAPDYVRQAVETLDRTGADLVGGPMVAVGKGRTAQAIALATSSPFGVGDARFHYITGEEEVDTVYQGLCLRELYDRLGGFDPEMVHDQDDELSFRIKAAGGRIVCNPNIRSEYHCRSTCRTLLRQYFQYGFWKVRLMQKWPHQMQARHFAPPVFATAVVTLPLLGLVWTQLTWLWLAMLGTYAVASVVATIASASGAASSRHVVVPLVFPILHLGYGVGFLTGLLSWPLRGVWHAGNIRYSVFEPSHLRLVQEVERTALRMLRDCGWESLSGRRVLDVGCGNGYWLRRMLDWGGQPQDLVGLDARADRVRAAADGLPARCTVCCADAAQLPWLDDSFDMVSQFVVFSSILDVETRARVADEMLRVLRSGGLVLWYDFHRDSPHNQDVAPVPRRELARLFPSCDLTVHSVTLAPPVARWFAERAPWLLGALSVALFLRTHHVAVMRYKG